MGQHCQHDNRQSRVNPLPDGTSRRSGNQKKKTRFAGLFFLTGLRPVLLLGQSPPGNSAALHPKCLHKSQCLSAQQVITHNNMCTRMHNNKEVAWPPSPRYVRLDRYLMTYNFPTSVDKIFTSFKLPKSIFERPSALWNLQVKNLSISGAKSILEVFKELWRILFSYQR